MYVHMRVSTYVCKYIRMYENMCGMRVSYLSAYCSLALWFVGAPYLVKILLMLLQAFPLLEKVVSHFTTCSLLHFFECNDELSNNNWRNFLHFNFICQLL